MGVPWLADVLREAGCKVIELPGWTEIGRPLLTVNGIVWHHTATGPNWTDARVAILLREGRSDLAGPLSQCGLQRDGTWVLVSANRANHNGYGEWGNASIGVEAYNDGVGEKWPQEQYDSYVRGTAAILARLGLDASHVKGHKETDPNRKIDPAGIDMNQARADITAQLTQPEDDMYTDKDRTRDEDTARKVNTLFNDYGVKGKGVRQVILHNESMLSRIASRLLVKKP